MLKNRHFVNLKIHQNYNNRLNGDETNKKVLFNCLISVAIALLYAITDELHQSFTGNRGPKFVDVLIDFSGSVIGVLIFIGFIYWYNKLIKRSRAV